MTYHMDQKLQASNRPCSNDGESALSGQLRFGGSSRRAHLRMQRAMEADNFNFCITDEGKAPTRKNLVCCKLHVRPLGFVAPIILPATSLMQSSCRRK